MDLDPNFPLAHYRLGQIYTLKGMYSEAIPELEKAVALSRSSPRATAELGLAHALNGNRAEALRLVRRSHRTIEAALRLALRRRAGLRRLARSEGVGLASESRARSLALAQLSRLEPGVCGYPHGSAVLRSWFSTSDSHRKVASAVEGPRV